jgi:hypothetical protein
MSLLNANVFFELGIRTALDKPVAMVKDDKTASVPFDASMINYHLYDSSLSPWTLKAEIATLEKHLTDTATRAQDRNSLWRYFGVRQRAEPADIENPTEAKLDLLLDEVAKLRARDVVRRPRLTSVEDPARTDYLKASETEPPRDADGRALPDGDEYATLRALLEVVAQIASENQARLVLDRATHDSAVLDLQTYLLNASQRERIFAAATADGIHLTLKNDTDPASPARAAGR